MERIGTRDIPGMLAGIVACEIAGVIGSIFTIPSIPTWYAALNKPFFTPPGWVFGPAWVALYALMGISAYLVWTKGVKKHEVRWALSLFAAQLFLNVLWSIAFFGMHSPLYGFAVIALLWVTLLATIILFYRISKTAAYLLVPYFLWGSFAAALNLAVLIMNP